MLEIKHIDVYYGKVQALFDVSLHVKDDEIISIIGANGAGKSTMMKTIMGLNKPAAGEIAFDNKIISTIPTHKIVHDRIVLIPEGREIFPKLSVMTNLEMGAYSRNYTKTEYNQCVESMFDMFPRLKERAKQEAGTLSGGEQQMLTIARGLMNQPKLLMLDEPSLGLAPVVVEEVFKIIKRIHKERNIPVILVEQNAFMALMISDRGYVLENGHMVMDGKSSILMKDEGVKKAYLGG